MSTLICAAMRESTLFSWGFDSYAESLLAQMARTCVYKDFDHPAATILTDDARRAEDRLRLHTPEIDHTVDLAFQEFDVTGRSLECGALMADVEATAPVTAVFVCLDRDDAALGTALGAHKAMARTGRWGSPVYVRMTTCGGIGDMLRLPAQAQRFPDVVKAFGMEDELCCIDLIEGDLEKNARKIHEAYLRTRNLAINGEFDPRRNESEQPWPLLRETYREANRRAADHVKAKLASIGCWQPSTLTLQVPIGFELYRGTTEMELLCELEHRSWSMGTRIDGWRAGPRRDNARKVHDNLVAFDDLDESVREFDRDQIGHIDRRLIERVDPKDTGGKAENHETLLIRRDLWIGMIAPRVITGEEGAWLHRQLSETILPKLTEKYCDCMLTLVSPFAPGGDQTLVEAAQAVLGDERRQHRQLIVEGIPEDLAIDAFGQALSGDPRLSWRGAKKGEVGVQREWRSVHSDMERSRAEARKASSDNWVIELAPAGDLPDANVHDFGRRHAAAYLVARCHLLIAVIRSGVCGGDRNPAPASAPSSTSASVSDRISESALHAAAGGAEEALEWWRDPTTCAVPDLLAAYSPHWPLVPVDGHVRRAIVLDLTHRTVKEETDRWPAGA